MNFNLSKDVEKNSGPTQLQYNTDHHEVIISPFMKNHSSTMQSTCSISSENLMESRLHVGELGLQSIHVDVGNAGDCFLRSVSHQLYDNSNHHMRKRTLLLGFNL